jgi:hypothetical protein
MRRCVPGDSDLDEDGSPLSEDCDDTNPDRFPATRRICSPIDEDCDEVIDNGDPAALWHLIRRRHLRERSCGCPALAPFDLDRSVEGCECSAEPAIDQGLSCESASISDALGHDELDAESRQRDARRSRRVVPRGVDRR